MIFARAVCQLRSQQLDDKIGDGATFRGCFKTADEMIGGTLQRLSERFQPRVAFSGHDAEPAWKFDALSPLVLKFDVASLDEGFSFALGLENLSGPLAVLGEVDHESERGAVTVTVGAESEGGLRAASVAAFQAILRQNG